MKSKLLKSASVVASLSFFCLGSWGAESSLNKLRLPMPVTSFGACKSGNFLYVYGGHTGEAHVYSEITHALHFGRVNLKDANKWESLPFNRSMQGLGMAGYRGKVYLSGGSRATNQDGKKSNLSSLTEVSIFNPKTKKWKDLTPLPQPRSSHEMVAHKGKLYVIGGWNLSLIHI